MIVVVTALIGESETAPPPPIGCGICYTDRDAPGWECRPPPPGYPRQAARRAKMGVLDDFPRAAWSIWIDAAFDLTCRPEEIVLAASETGCDVAGFAHPDRCRIRDEAREVIRLGLAPKDRVGRQIEAYRLGGFDSDNRPQAVLTTTGVLVRRHTPAVHAFTRRWLDEIEHWTLRDQLSVDYAAWRCGVEIGHLPGHYRNNRFARYNRIRHVQRRVAA